MEIRDKFEFLQVANSLEFRFAKTCSKTNPHEYCWAESPVILEKVQALNKFIQENGEKEKYFGDTYDVYFVDGHKYWSMDYWANTQVLNRNWDFKNEDGTINKSRTEEKKDA